MYLRALPGDKRVSWDFLNQHCTGVLHNLETRFKTITLIEELDRLFAQSRDVPVILFKHSLTCPVSSAAYSEMENVNHDVAIIPVQRARDVSNEVEARTAVPHESPQVLVVVDGRVVWSVSHWNVTADAVNAVNGAVCAAGTHLIRA